MGRNPSSTDIRSSFVHGKSSTCDQNPNEVEAFTIEFRNGSSSGILLVVESVPAFPVSRSRWPLTCKNSIAGLLLARGAVECWLRKKTFRFSILYSTALHVVPKFDLSGTRWETLGAHGETKKRKSRINKMQSHNQEFSYDREKQTLSGPSIHSRITKLTLEKWD